MAHAAPSVTYIFSAKQCLRAFVTAIGAGKRGSAELSFREQSWLPRFIHR